jgi:hypothetical protein
MTKDPNEVINILDMKNYNSNNDNIFKKLNTILNQSIIDKKLFPTFFISPYEPLLDFVNSLLTKINLYNVSQNENIQNFDFSNQFYNSLNITTIVDELYNFFNADMNAVSQNLD